MRYKEKFHQLFYSIIFWIFITLFFVIVRSYGQEEVLNVPPLNLIGILPELLLISVVFGILIFIIDLFFQKHIENRVSYFVLILLKSFSYLLLLFLGSMLFSLVEGLLDSNKRISLEVFFAEHFINKQLNTLVIYFYFSIVFIIYNFYQQIKDRFAPGVLSKIFLGKFHHPKEVNRIFMFIDLKSSTTYAESLGHIKYSELIKDCFEDLAESVLKHKAEIYQYVGDGVVLTWDIESGLKNNNCFNLFYSYKESINNRRNYYKNKYGFIPEFKAGLNMGIVTVTEVGKYKKEIAYHGDAINTAARIQDKCNKLNEELLISDSLKQEIEKYDYIISAKGNFLLKGKKLPSEIYALYKQN